MLDNDIYSATIYISFFNTQQVRINITLEEIKIWRNDVNVLTCAIKLLGEPENKKVFTQ